MQKKYIVLYTHQKNKKRRTWTDGYAQYNPSNRKLLLKDEDGRTLDSDFLKEDPDVGDEVELARHLVQIEEFDSFVNTEKKPSQRRGPLLASGTPPGRIPAGRGFQQPVMRSMARPKMLNAPAIKSVAKRSPLPAQPHASQPQKHIPLPVKPPVIQQQIPQSYLNPPLARPPVHPIPSEYLQPAPPAFLAPPRPLADRPVAPQPPAAHQLPSSFLLNSAQNSLHPQPQFPPQNNFLGPSASFVALAQEPPPAAPAPASQKVKFKRVTHNPTEMTGRMALFSSAPTFLGSSTGNIHTVPGGLLAGLLQPFDLHNARPLVVPPVDSIKETLALLEKGDEVLSCPPRFAIDWAQYTAHQIHSSAAQITFSLLETLLKMNSSLRDAARGARAASQAAKAKIDTDNLSLVKGIRLHTGCTLLPTRFIKKQQEENFQDSPSQATSGPSEPDAKLLLPNAYSSNYSHGDVWVISTSPAFRVASHAVGSFTAAATGEYHAPARLSGDGGGGRYSFKSRKKKKRKFKNSKTNNANFVIPLKLLTPMKKTKTSVKVRALHLPDSSFQAASIRQLLQVRSSKVRIAPILAGGTVFSDTIDPLFASQTEEEDKNGVFGGAPVPLHDRLQVAEDLGATNLLNQRQQLAINTFCELLGADDASMLLIRGLFGAGKSHLLVSMIRAAWKLCNDIPGVRILLLSGTNVATDRLLLSLFESLEEEASEPNAAGKTLERAVIRVGSLRHMSKFSRKFHVQRRDASFEGKISEAFLIATTCASCQNLFALAQKSTLEGQSFFPIVFVDEACQVAECDLVPPLAMANPFLAVMAGDERQLPSVNAIEMLKRSLFEDLLILKTEGEKKKEKTDFLKNLHVVELNTQYRCHPEIAGIASKLFYKGIVVSAGGLKDRRESLIPRLAPGVAAICVPYSDCQMVGSSWESRKEALVVSAFIKRLISLGQEPSGIGVITPYKAHALAIKKCLGIYRPPSAKRVLAGAGEDSSDKKNEENVVVSTVDAFQGQERQIIIVSLVKEYPKTTSFLCDKQRTNVAITRAKNHLILFRSHGSVVPFEPPAGNDPWGEVENTAAAKGTMFRSLKDFEKDNPCPPYGPLRGFDFSMTRSPEVDVEDSEDMFPTLQESPAAADAPKEEDEAGPSVASASILSQPIVSQAVQRAPEKEPRPAIEETPAALPFAQSFDDWGDEDLCEDISVAFGAGITPARVNGAPEPQQDAPQLAGIISQQPGPDAPSLQLPPPKKKSKGLTQTESSPIIKLNVSESSPVPKRVTFSPTRRMILFDPSTPPVSVNVAAGEEIGMTPPKSGNSPVYHLLPPSPLNVINSLLEIEPGHFLGGCEWKPRHPLYSTAPDEARRVAQNYDELFGCSFSDA
eukprot:gnl/Chilomastix_cuspidata/2681.p1 GENE.gnl/Chilomastix_cuspidata/2681~~gnl/Chilomastix_cuspidata/2681.p1  ORF type:complete len:1369 (+),score=385.71 gnl/Chilomastix_cuspidata/2681:35-4141(+)